MKIVQPSATVIEDELSALSVYQRIDTAASVCYQRNPKPTEEEAIKFCRSMVNRGHLATLEFATLHLMVECESTEDQLCGERYIQVTWIPTETFQYIVSGSVRAFMEAKDVGIMSEIKSYLSPHLPEFFPRHAPSQYGAYRFALPDEIPDSHKHVAVRFIVNRAVTHELVRHRPCGFLQESQRYCRYEDEVTFIEPHDNWPLSARLTWANDMEWSEKRYKYYLKMGLSPQQARAVLPNATKTELLAYANLPEWKHIFNLRCSPAADPEMTRIMRPLRDEFVLRWPGCFA